MPRDRPRRVNARSLMPPGRLRLAAVLLIVVLTALSAYAGSRQLHDLRPDSASSDQIESVRAIHSYLERVEQALRTADPASIEP